MQRNGDSSASEDTVWPDWDLSERGISLGPVVDLLGDANVEESGVVVPEIDVTRSCFDEIDAADRSEQMGAGGPLGGTPRRSLPADIESGASWVGDSEQQGSGVGNLDFGEGQQAGSTVRQTKEPTA